MPGHYDAGPGIAPDPKYLKEQPSPGEYEHSPNCSMVVISGCDACDCDPSQTESIVTPQQYTLVHSQFDDDLVYIRKGDGSHSSQDVARILLKKPFDEEESSNLLALLGTILKVK